MAEHIARDTDLSTLWFRVLDGSLVRMRLYDKGGEVDRAVVDVDPSDPDGMHAIAQEPIAAAWDRLLVDGQSGDTLRAKWNSTGRTADEKVVTISNLIGLDPSHSESTWPERRERGEIALETALRFTLTDNAPWLAAPGSQPRLCLIPLSVFRRHATMNARLGRAHIGQLVSCGGRDEA